MQYTTSIIIHAPIEKVWNLMSQIGAYSAWSSGVTDVEGTAALGNKIKLYSEVSPGKAFPLKVTEFVPQQKMTFVGGMPLGLFKGTRMYTLAETAAGVQFTMTEVYTGPMAGMITKSIPNLTPSFEKFAQGLKAESEQ